MHVELAVSCCWASYVVDPHQYRKRWGCTNCEVFLWSFDVKQGFLQESLLSVACRKKTVKYEEIFVWVRNFMDSPENWYMFSNFDADEFAGRRSWSNSLELAVRAFLHSKAAVVKWRNARRASCKLLLSVLCRGSSPVSKTLRMYGLWSVSVKFRSQTRISSASKVFSARASFSALAAWQSASLPVSQRLPAFAFYRVRWVDVILFLAKAVAVVGCLDPLETRTSPCTIRFLPR